jgi:hypothetical protein
MYTVPFTKPCAYCQTLCETHTMQSVPVVEWLIPSLEPSIGEILVCRRCATFEATKPKKRPAEMAIYVHSMGLLHRL